MNAEHNSKGDSENTAETPKSSAEDETEVQDGEAASDTSPSNRRHARLTTPLKIRINDKTYSALDWSLSGFRIGDVDEFPLSGNRVDIDVIMPFGNFSFEFKGVAAVRWFDLGTRQAGCEFENLNTQQKSVLSYFVASFIKGRTLTIEDAVKAVKPEVDEVNVTAEGEAIYATKWHLLRGFSQFGVQIGVALAALVFLGLLIRTILLSTFSFDSTAAWVDTPPVLVNAPISGPITVLTVAEGMELRPGDPIAVFRDDALSTQIDVARAELNRLRFAHATLLEDAGQRDVVLLEQRELAELNLETAEAQARAATETANSRQVDYERVQALQSRGVASNAHLQEAMRLRVEAESARRVADANRRAAESQVAIAENGYFVGTSRITGDDPEFLNRAAADLSQEIVVQETMIAGLQRQADGLVILSPCNCIVSEVPRRELERMAVGQLVVILREIETTGRIVAFVTHEEAAALAQGQTVSVRISDGSVDEGAVIAAIDTRPTPTNVRMLSSRGHEPSLVAEVTIELTDPVDTLVRAPVDVVFVQPPMLWLERMLYFDF